MVGHHVPDGIVTQRGLVELIVQQLLHLLTLRVDHEDTLMVCADPDPATFVGHHVPDLQRVGQWSNAMCL